MGKTSAITASGALCFGVSVVGAAETASQIVAQGTDPLSGGAGWIGAGLLGMVLGWLLMVHLPAKDKQLGALLEAKDKQQASLLESKDRQHADIIRSFTEAEAALQLAFSERNDKTLEVFSSLTREERQIYQKWHEENRSVLMQVLEEIKDGRHAMANLRHELGIKRAVEEEAQKRGPKEG